MSNKRECLVVVHLGSALGSANMNLGKLDARAARDALASEFEQWTGDVVVIHGALSDELPCYPHLQRTFESMLARSRAAGHEVAVLDGDDASEHNQEDAIDEWLASRACEPGSVHFRVTGSWYHPADGGGCVGSVIDRLRERGHVAEVDDSAVTLDLDAPGDGEENECEDVLSSLAEAASPDLPAWPEGLEDILSQARAKKWSGFGGECFAHALVLAEVLWPERPIEFVGAFNRAFYDEGRPIGHVAIEVSHQGQSVYLDADGRPKTWKEIESWGMLDSQDDDYQDLADELGVDWNDETALDAVDRKSVV